MVDGRMCFLCQFIPLMLAKEIRDLRNKEDGGSVPLLHATCVLNCPLRLPPSARWYFL